MIVFTLGVRPSALIDVYWTHSLRDLQTITRLRMEYEMVKASSFTESLAEIAKALFPSEEGKRGDGDVINSVDDAMALAARINAGG